MKSDKEKENDLYIFNDEKFLNEHPEYKVIRETKTFD